MQEFINGQVFLKGKFIKKNFLISDGKIFFKYKKTQKPIDIDGKIVAPGFIDMHVHTRIPGFEYKEDIPHVSEAALKGGFTTIVAMANVHPSPTDVKTFKAIKKLLKESPINILQAARVTKNQKPVNFKELSKYTKIYSDDGEPISSKELMSSVLLEAKKYDSLLLLHEEDSDIKGYAYASEMTKQEGITSFNHTYESNIVKRDIKLNSRINTSIHIQHVSTFKTVDFLRKTQQQNITAEVTPHHIFFNNTEITNDGNFKMNPPIGSKKDQKALIKAFKEGIIKIIATDHAPHAKKEKDGGFIQSANGVIGLETAFASINTKIPNKLETIISALTIHPAKLLGIDIEIRDGKNVNIVIIDPKEKWVFIKKEIASKSQNSPFLNRELIGRIKNVFYKNIERSY